MKYLLIACAAGLAFGLMGCDARSAQEATSQAAKKATEVAKGGLTGIGEGVDSGRKATTGPDGAVVLSNRADLDGFVDVSILTVEPAKEGTGAVVTVAMANKATAHPVRVAGLRAKGAVIALDKDGFATELATLNGDDFDVTIPADAKVKCVLTFPAKAEEIVKLRVWGKDVLVKGK